MSNWHNGLRMKAKRVDVYFLAQIVIHRVDRLNRLTNKVDTAGISTGYGYGYDPNGNLVSIQYGSLAPVTFGYDALNRRTNMVDAVGTTVWTYDTLGRLVSEQGPFSTGPVTATYDDHGRMTGVSFGSYSATYTLDGKGRITAVQAPEGGYSFSYLKEGFKRTLVTYPNGVKETRGYDALTRMTNLVYKKWLTTLLSIDYRHDHGDRRTNEVWSTGRHLDYGYDRAHQIVSAVSTGRASDSVNYVYDKAGNPTSRKELGLTTAYTFNNLNQFSSGSWTGRLTVIGEVNYAAGTVTVNGVTGQIFPDRVFEATNITVAAGTNVLTAIYHGPAFTNTQMVATNTSTVIMADPVFGYDAKGNLTNDAEFVYQFDIANRLTNVIAKASGSSVLAAQYEGLGRRVEVTRDGSTIERYVYFPGSFLVLAVLDGSNQVKESYTHGPDLSGAVGSAGGIGGILSASHLASPLPLAFFHADAMGNVVLVTDPDGEQVASYGYTPFGKLINQIGSYHARFLFSSKELDPETGLVYYGYRYLNSSTGRWTQRDPIGQRGGANLYRFVGNSPLQYVDPFGLQTWFELHRELRREAGTEHLIDESIRDAQTAQAVIETTVDLTPVGDVVALTTGKDVRGNEVGFIGKTFAFFGFFSLADEFNDARKIGQICERSSVIADVNRLARKAKITDDFLINKVRRLHGPSSAVPGKSKFFEGFDIKKGVRTTLDSADSLILPNTGGRGGFIVVRDFTESIGASPRGKAVTRLKVVLDEGGNLITAFPVR